MIDSTALAVLVEDFRAAGSKSAVLRTHRRPRGPRWTPTSTCCSRPCMSRPTIFCLNDRTTPRVGSQTPRSSRCAWPRRSWASRLTGGSWRRRQASGALVSRAAQQPGTSNAAADWRTPWSGSWGSSPAKARASRMICCSSTRPRSSARAPGRRPNAPRWVTRPTTATALSLPLFLGLSPARDLLPGRHPQSTAARVAQDR